LTLALDGGEWSASRPGVELEPLSELACHCDPKTHPVSTHIVDEICGQFRELHIEELLWLHRSPTIVKIVKSP